MVRKRVTIVEVSNSDVAGMLDEMARLLQLQGASPFRLAAYRRAAATIRRTKEPLARLFEREGVAGLLRLPAVGTSLAKKIAEIFRQGRSRPLERLRRRQATGDLLTTLPAVGPRLAERIRQRGIHSLEEVWAAARDGRLRRIEGFGRKRVQAVQSSLAARLGAEAAEHVPVVTAKSQLPSVADLLDIDGEYRLAASRGKLPRVAPKRFNPTGAAWLPILRTDRGGRHFLAHFDNSARSHERGHVADWVVIYCTDKARFGRSLVLTAPSGPLRGRRVVKGRERECQEHDRDTGWVQLPLLGT